MDTVQNKKEELYHLINELPDMHLTRAIKYLKSLIITENISIPDGEWSEEDEKNFSEVEKALKKPFEKCSGTEYSVAVDNKIYEVILYADMESGGYWVDCPSLPGCASEGDTKEEAIEMIKDSIAGHLYVLRKSL